MWVCVSLQSLILPELFKDFLKNFQIWIRICVISVIKDAFIWSLVDSPKCPASELDILFSYLQLKCYSTFLNEKQWPQYLYDISPQLKVNICSGGGTLVKYCQWVKQRETLWCFRHRTRLCFQRTDLQWSVENVLFFMVDYTDKMSFEHVAAAPSWPHELFMLTLT